MMENQLGVGITAGNSIFLYTHVSGEVNHRY